MICILALFTFSFLSLFSIKYRVLAKEAFRCVSRRVTLRPCDTEFNKKIRALITGKLMRRTPRIAGVVNRRFELISWTFTIILFVSLFFTGQAMYNYVQYGSCDPHAEFCVFNPDTYGTGDVVSCGSEHCAINGCECGEAESLCAPENNYAACDGDCDCSQEVCGEKL